jgi:hypothetical protein
MPYEAVLINNIRARIYENTYLAMAASRCRYQSDARCIVIDRMPLAAQTNQAWVKRQLVVTRDFTFPTHRYDGISKLGVNA